VLRALFAAEHNKSSAAHALGVDRDTVHRQLKEIERRLDCRVHERHAEIDIALRVEELREQPDPPAVATSDGTIRPHGE
jgi:PucR C-terminal helix-turn-helix domain